MRIFQGLGSAATETASYAIAATLFPVRPSPAGPDALA